jgi:hypothetical protein
LWYNRERMWLVLHTGIHASQFRSFGLGCSLPVQDVEESQVFLQCAHHASLCLRRCSCPQVEEVDFAGRWTLWLWFCASRCVHRSPPNTLPHVSLRIQITGLQILWKPKPLRF